MGSVSRVDAALLGHVHYIPNENTPVYTGKETVIPSLG